MLATRCIRQGVPRWPNLVARRQHVAVLGSRFILPQFSARAAHSSLSSAVAKPTIDDAREQPREPYEMPHDVLLALAANGDEGVRPKLTQICRVYASRI